MLRKISILSVITCCVAISVLAVNVDVAQAGFKKWEQAYGDSLDEGAQDVRQTLDGGYIIAGTKEITESSNTDFYLIKTDSAGNAEWTQTYGGNELEYADCVQQTSDSGFIIVGSTHSYGAGGGDVYLVKTDDAGDTVWTRTYGGSYGDEGHFVRQTFDGGYIITGRTYSYGQGSPTHNNVYLIKTDHTGSVEWSYSYGKPYCDGGYCVEQVSSDSGYIVTGWTSMSPEPYNRRYDVYLLRTSSSGDSLWATSYGLDDHTTDLSDWGEWIEETDDGGFIIAGSNRCFKEVDQDIWLLKTDEDGDTLWTRTFGGTTVDYGYCVQQTSGGGYIVSGAKNREGDIFIVQTDSAGNGMWQLRNYVGSEGRSVLQASDGCFAAVGYTDSIASGGDDFYLFKIDSSYVCGDANGGGSVELGDVGYIRNYLYFGGPEPQPKEAGDADGDGSIDASDMTYILNYLYIQGPEPECPDGLVD